MAFTIIEINSEHARSDFCCGKNDDIDRFCREFALDHNTNDFTRVKVALGDDQRVVGFYTLAANNLRGNKKLMQYLDGHEKDCPAFHLQMIAICQNQERKSLGPALMYHAFRSAVRAAKDVGARLIFLQAASQSLVPYYEGYGFRLIERGTGTMYVPMNLVRDAVSEPEATNDDQNETAAA
ncbi:MAG: hypothetical protein ACRYFE_09090 [Janthinobacterium lividum]